jgi:hypothetical protein
MSQASFRTGSQHLTIGTLATALQTTFSMPSVRTISNFKFCFHSRPCNREESRHLLLCKSIASECMLSSFFSDVVTHMSTSESSLLNRFPELPKTATSMLCSGHSSFIMCSNFLINVVRRSSLSALGNNRPYSSRMSLDNLPSSSGPSLFFGSFAGGPSSWSPPSR